MLQVDTFDDVAARCDFRWATPPPTVVAVAELLEEAGEVLEAFDARHLEPNLFQQALENRHACVAGRQAHVARVHDT